MGQAQINVRTRACSRTSIARTRQAALTHNVRGKEIIHVIKKNIGRPVLVIVGLVRLVHNIFFYKYRVKVLQISHGGFTCDPVNVGSII